MATLVDYEARNGRPPTGPSSATTSSSSYRKPRKAIIESDPEDEVSTVSASVIEKFHSSSTTTYTMDTDISQLEAPTFTTIDRGPSKTMLNLKWDHMVNLVGKKVVNPMIHCCDACLKPILIYGRMIPCKHVFCLNCATNQSVKCSRCGDKVSRVEPVGLGSIYMCSHGGSRYGNAGCRRTYLSQRDLQAHIQHRHMKNSAQTASVSTTERKESRTVPPQNVNYHDNNAASGQEVFRTQTGARNSISYPPLTQPSVQNYSQPPPSHISVMTGGTRSSNLITVPIHDSSTSREQQSSVTSHPPPSMVAPQYSYGHSVPGSATNFSQPPPVATQGHFYATNQPPSYSSDSGQSQYSSQWRTNNSSYYRR